MSPFDDKQLKGLTPIHETEDFVVMIGALRSEGDFKGLTGYLVVNRRTSVVEGEMTLEYAAVRAMRELQSALESTLENVPEEQEAESFEEMLQRLGGPPPRNDQEQS